MSQKSGAAARREQIAKQFWPKEDLWTGDNEKGWFASPRTLPLIVALLASKSISPRKQNPSSVYLELLSRQLGEGVVEMVHEADHAFASGYEGQRAVRTWHERMKLLEQIGFIKIEKVGNRFKYVGIIHPTTAIQKLRDKGKVPENWWKAYVTRKAETKEPTYEQRELKNQQDSKVVTLQSQILKKTKTAKP